MIKIKCEISHKDSSDDIIVKLTQVKESGQMIIEGEYVEEVREKIEDFIYSYSFDKCEEDIDNKAKRVDNVLKVFDEVDEFTRAL